MSASDFDERVVTIPLREATAGSKTDLADTSMRIIREHLARHFSVDTDAVRLDPSINEAIWADGRGGSPSKLRVRAARFEEEGTGVVEAEIAE